MSEVGVVHADSFEHPRRRRIFTWWRGCGVLLVAFLVVAAAGAWWLGRELFWSGEFTVINESSRPIRVLAPAHSALCVGASVRDIPPGGRADFHGSLLCSDALIASPFVLGGSRYVCSARDALREGSIRVTDDGIVNMKCETQ